MCGRWDGRPSIDYHPGGSVYRIARWVFTYLAHWHMALINKIGHACVPNTYQRWPYRENQLCSSLYCKIGTAYCHIHHLIEVNQMEWYGLLSSFLSRILSIVCFVFLERYMHIKVSRVSYAFYQFWYAKPLLSQVGFSSSHHAAR